MSDEIGEAMDDYDIDEFLERHALGVLGLAAGGESYTIPIAFAYDRGASRCIFRFIMPRESTKRSFVAETDVASLVAYEWNGANDWRSVVLRGTLERLDGDEMAEAAALFSDLGEEAALEVFNRPIPEYETGWYELRIDERTGRARFG